MSCAERSPRPWWDHRRIRITGAAASWFLFSLSISLLLHASMVVMSLGGSCASGGPYEIAVECPDEVVTFVPLSIFGGLIAVAIGIVLARGFGTPLTTWGWPVLFCGLGAVFLFAFFGMGDPIGLVIGGFFEVMGIIPLILELRGSPQRVLIGLRNVDGARFLEGRRATPSLLSPGAPNPDGAVPPGAVDWVLALGILVVFVLLGYWVAGQWLYAVAVAATTVE